MDKSGVSVRKDGSEAVAYNFRDLFVHLSLRDLSDQPGQATTPHWHEDIELVSVVSGRMQYNVNGGIVNLEQGDGIIVNSRQMHHAFSPDGTSCEYLRLLLHPMLLCISHQTENDLVAPLISDPSLPYIPLHSHVPWEREALNSIQTMYECRGMPSAPLYIQSHFCLIWALVFDNVEQCRRHFESQQKQDQKLVNLKSMVSYIQKHYREKISLEDIAKAGYMSKNSCLMLFKRYLGDTPINFLIAHRLKLGARLLRDSDATVTDIAYQVGFSNASYFAGAFQKAYGCKPLEYRRDHAGDRPAS